MNQRTQSDDRVDLNHASREELVELPFIGERLAEAIIDYRITQGGFRSFDELDNVGGIDLQVKKALQDRVRI